MCGIGDRLAEHPEILQAAVLVRDDASGGRTGRGWWPTAFAGAIPSAAELRGYLREQLPSYMVPAAYVRLATLPLIASGKIDYRALPEPESAPERKSTVPPRDEVERRLARIWEKLLDVEAVSVDDDSFELGGHSLLVVRLMARV